MNTQLERIKTQVMSWLRKCLPLLLLYLGFLAYAAAQVPNGPGTSGSSSSSSSCRSCSSSSRCGLAGWLVSEPAVNLWIEDTPLFYNPSRGAQMAFFLSYKNLTDAQGELDSGATNVFSVGRHWHTPWRAYLEVIPAESTNYWVYQGNGAVRKASINVIDYLTLTKVVQTSGTNVLQFPDGSQHFFGLTNTIGGVTRYFITRQQDAQGNSVQFQYTTTANTIRLNKVIDVDNKEVTFEYTSTSNYSNLVSKVIMASYGLTNLLQYDTAGNLTNIVDTINLTSQLKYASNNLTQLITPYGTNKFTYFSQSNTYVAIKVNEHGVRNHFFLFQEDENAGKTDTTLLSYLSSTTNAPYFAIPNTCDGEDANLRNSYYWGPRQYDNLSSGVQDDLDADTFSISELTTADYYLSRLQHWLKDTNGTHTSYTLSHEWDPSPDGWTEGHLVWFDYENKAGGAADNQGTMSLPSLEATTLPNGDSTFVFYQRNEWGNPTNVVQTYTDPDGAVKARTNQFVYASNGIDLIKHLRLEGGATVQVTSNAYNGFHQVLTNFNAVGDRTVYTYNSKQQLTSLTHPSGLIENREYETTGASSNFLKKVTEPAISKTNSYTYLNGYVLTHTDERGLTITQTWDKLGRQIKEAFPDGTYHTNVYSNLDLVKSLNRLGHTNQWEYNSFRQATKHINANFKTNTFTYCGCGTLDSQTDPEGGTTTYTYDLMGRLLTTSYPAGWAQTNVFNLAGQLVEVIQANGVRMTNAYNNQGLFMASSNHVGRVSHTVFDLEDSAVRVSDANSGAVTNVFDDLGRLSSATHPNSGIERMGYSPVGLLTYTNSLGMITRYAYDVAGRKLAETNSNNEILQFTYNAAGELLTLKDGKNQVTTWKYDEYGRATNKLDAASNLIFIYKLDAEGRLTNRWSISKGHTFYSYDAVGNLTKIDYATSTDITFKYDANNRLTNMVDAVGTTSFAYNADGDLTGEDGPWTADTISYGYNLNRLRNSLSLEEAGASPWSLTYGYDAALRLTSISAPEGTYSYAYDGNAKMQVKRLMLPNGVYITNTFNEMAQPTGTYLKNSSHAVLHSHQYTYNVGNQRTQQTFSTGNYVDYGYDDIGQVKTATGKESGGTTRLNEKFGYTYDAAWNLSTRTNDALVQTFNVNSLNQLTTITRSGTLTVAGTTSSTATNVTVNALAATLYADNAFAKAGFTVTNGNNAFTAVASDSHGRSDTHAITVNLPSTVTCSYDLNGNLLADGRRFFDYDDENQLIRVTVTNILKSEFSYDGKMRRRIKKDFNWTGSAWSQTNEIRYVYDGMLVIQERDSSDLARVTYTRGNDLSGSLESAGGIGGLLARTDASVPQYYFCDGNGNVTALANSSQGLIARYHYDPFGNTLSGSGPAAEVNTYRFSSKDQDPASGLYYYGYRFYDPNLQRWLTHDPIEEAGGVNLYTYVGNAPLDAVDPLGQAAGAVIGATAGSCVCPGVGTVVGAIVGAVVSSACLAVIVSASGHVNPKGRCNDQQHAALQKAVDQMCGQTRQCKGGQTLQTLRSNLTKNLQCEIARNTINQTCYDGGDAGHRQAAEEARNAQATCRALIILIQPKPAPRAGVAPK